VWDPVSGEIRVLPEFRVDRGRTTCPSSLRRDRRTSSCFRSCSSGGHAKNFPPVDTVLRLDGPCRSILSRLGRTARGRVPQLDDWTTRRRAIRYYSGIATYRKTLIFRKITCAAACAWILHGEDIAGSGINGKDLGVSVALRGESRSATTSRRGDGT